LAAVTRAFAAVIPERLERPLRSSAFRRLALGKSILNQSYELSAHQVFAQGSQAQAVCYTSSEHRDSVLAFLNKTN